MPDSNLRRIARALPVTLAAMQVTATGALYGADVSPVNNDNKPSTETVCEKQKILAAGRYYQCLARSLVVTRDDSFKLPEIAIARCDRVFDEAFEHAEAGGQCRTAGGPATLRGPITGQAQAMAEVVATGPGCPTGNLTVISGETATCRVSTSSSAIDLAAIVSQLSAQGVSMDTPVWIQAWGASGAAGAEGNGGEGGPPGYAQTTTTGAEFLSDFGVTEIYYYLGDNGTTPTSSGGGGGAATVVAVNDSTESAATFAETVLVAGGGGGGGAGRGPKQDVCPGSNEIVGGFGGGGGIAIASGSQTGAVALAAGRPPSERLEILQNGHAGGGDLSGPGGEAGGHVNGSVIGNAQAGNSGVAGLGGAGGGTSSSSNNPKAAFINQPTTMITGAGGRGGQPGDDAGGGGGGGGYGGGGGGIEGDGNSSCISGGGGGGGSMAIQAKADCSAAPTSAPSNPNGNDEGFVQIVFDLGACGSN